MRALSRDETVQMLAPHKRRARATSQTATAAGETFGPYAVFEELGTGGMASVHRAELRGVAGFRKPIALKRMLPEIASDEASVAAFTQEARLASQLVHHNVAQTYDLGEHEGTYFIAMEYVHGPTLKQVMVASETEATGIPVPLVAEILIQLCDALDHAHSARDERGRPLGIIHRDVSPSNVIVSSSGVVKLIDFGIAKAARSATRTAVGVMKGKLGYIAPEYLEGRAIDSRVDLYAVGVIAHELLTGERMFVGPNDFANAIAERKKPIDPPSLANPEVTRDLDDIVMLALQPDPDKRWQSAQAMRVALANVAREMGVYVGGQQMRELAEKVLAQIAVQPRRRRLASGSNEVPGASLERTMLVRPRKVLPWLIGASVAGATAVTAAWLLGWLPFTQ
jgi:eukaryotic-like serine/threonine-protein kinase